MEALQYIYTSWKNGDSPDKGYMIYSRSRGITEAECAAIKETMQYLPPKGLSMAPAPEEIAETFPYSFAYFTLPSGRGCVAQSTYLGRDYSGRFGNYIIYAIVFRKEELPCRPAEFFAEPFMKTAMTPEELNAPSPVPPLPPLRNPSFGSVIHDEQISEFVYGKEAEFARLIAMILAARDREIPFYLNDSRENLVLWAAAAQRVLPAPLSLGFTFDTYAGNPEEMRSMKAKERGLDFHMIGVRPDANYFNYAVEARSSRHIVLDFLGSGASAGIFPGEYAHSMAESAALDFGESDAFGDFIAQTSFRRIDSRLECAYLFYKTLHGAPPRPYPSDKLEEILRFGEDFCRESDNAAFGEKLLALLREQELKLNPGQMEALWFFVIEYVDYMVFSLYDLITDSVYAFVSENGDGGEALRQLASFKGKSAAAYQGYLDYIDSGPVIEQLAPYLSGNPRLSVNDFYMQWLLDSYRFPQGLREGGRPVAKLLRVLTDNLRAAPESVPLLAGYLLRVSGETALLEDMLYATMPLLEDSVRRREFVAAFAETARQHPDAGERVEGCLFRIPAAEDLAVEIAVGKILDSRNPNEAFRSFCQRQERVIPPRILARIAAAFLRSLNESSREAALIRTLDAFPDEVLQQETLRKPLCAALKRVGVQSFSRWERRTLERAYRLCGETEAMNYPALQAVWIGERSLAAPQTTGVFPLINALQLSRFSRKEYEAYVKRYFPGFLRQVSSSQAMGQLLNAFYCPGGASALAEACLSEIRQQKREERKSWRNLTVWLCAFVLSAEGSEAKWKEIRYALIRFLRKLNDFDMNDVYRELLRETTEQKCLSLLHEARRKETIPNLIGGIFRRKP